MRAVHLSINWLLSTCYKCPNLALDLAAKLHNFWETWESLGAGPKIKDLMRATLSPLDQTQLDKVTDHHKHYVNPLRDQFLDEDVTLPLKKCSTKKWVTSIDFKDAYFGIPIQEQSRKYMRFHIQGRSYQFKALPSRLSTAPMEFTVITVIL